MTGTNTNPTGGASQPMRSRGLLVGLTILVAGALAFLVLRPQATPLAPVSQVRLA
jgi:hypothetical protein